MSVYKRIGEAVGESLEDVCNMQEEERRELIQTLGLQEVVDNIEQGRAEIIDITEPKSELKGGDINVKIAAAIGETVDSVERMPKKEKRDLIEVLGLGHLVKDDEDEDNAGGPSAVIDTAELSSDSDDDLLLANTETGDTNDNIVIGDTEEGGGVARGWGECPVCQQIMPNTKLGLHAMACQGIELNGGEGLEVNPMEVQSRCDMCSCLVPDLVMEEHKEGCWGNNANKRRIETPMERRRAKYPKTNVWAAAPRR